MYQQPKEFGKRKRKEKEIEFPRNFFFSTEVIFGRQVARQSEVMWLL